MYSRIYDNVWLIDKNKIYAASSIFQNVLIWLEDVIYSNWAPSAVVVLIDEEFLD